MTRLVAAIFLLLLLVSACGTTSDGYDVEWKARFEACTDIQNEELRVRCFKEIPTKSGLNRPD